MVSFIEQREESHGNEAAMSMIKGYRAKIESELAKICKGISTFSTSTSFLRLPLVSPRSSTIRCAPFLSFFPLFFYSWFWC